MQTVRKNEKNVTTRLNFSYLKGLNSHLVLVLVNFFQFGPTIEHVIIWAGRFILWSSHARMQAGRFVCSVLTIEGCCQRGGS